MKWLKGLEFEWKKSYFAEIAVWLAFIIMLFIKCVYFQYSTGISHDEYFARIPKNMITATLAAILIIAGFVMLISNKRRYVSLIITNSILSLLLLSDTVYYRYYQNVITIPVLRQLGLAGDIGKSVLSLLKASDLIFVIDILLAIAGLVTFCRMKGKEYIFRIHRILKLSLCFILIFAGILTINKSYGRAGANLFQYDNKYTIQRMGILYFHVYEADKFAKNNMWGDRSLSDEEVKMINSFYEGKKHSNNRYSATQKGKNLVIIQLEAIQNFLIDAKVDGREITPVLNHLAKNSLYFSNAYYQTSGGNTSDAEFVTNTSLYAADKGSAYFRYPANKYHALPHMLNIQGYNSYVFHANNPSFWNRNEVYPAIGFEKFYSELDFEPGQRLGWGLNDRSFFIQSLEKIENEQPFYAFLVSLSSHHPYGAFKNFSFNAGKYEGTILGNYFKAANYVDKAVENLLNFLEKKNLKDNTLLVLYGDHQGITIDRFSQVAEFMGVEYNEYNTVKEQKVPLIITGTGIESQRISNVCGQIDIVPTVCNLMGIEAPYALGRDVLGVKNGYVVLRNGSVLTDEYYYINGNDYVYDSKTGKKIDKEPYSEEIDKLKNTMRISDLILYKDAFREYEIKQKR